MQTTIATQLGAAPFSGAELLGDSIATRAALRTFAGNCRKQQNLSYTPVRTYSMDMLRDAYNRPEALAIIIGSNPTQAAMIGHNVASAPYNPRNEAEPRRPMPGPLGASARANGDAETETSEDDDDADDDARAIAEILRRRKAPLDEARVIDLIRQHAPKAEPRGVAITIGNAPAVTIDNAHQMLATVCTYIASGSYPALVGPAGTGKTELIIQAAKAFGRPFHLSGAVDSPYKLSGFMDAQGRYVRTAFREAFEHGGVFLLDEADRSSATALTWLNSALANGACDFPDGVIKRHPDFVCAIAANTYGRGSDRQYVGANQLDASTIDRFDFLEVDYDENLERQLAGNDDWSDYVQRLRASARRCQARLVISMRASIRGARLLAAGIDRAQVAESVIWKGIDAATRAKIEAA